jgi:hypothetical protein
LLKILNARLRLRRQHLQRSSGLLGSEVIRLMSARILLRATVWQEQGKTQERRRCVANDSADDLQSPSAKGFVHDAIGSRSIHWIIDF